MESPATQIKSQCSSGKKKKGILIKLERLYFLASAV